MDDNVKLCQVTVKNCQVLVKKCQEMSSYVIIASSLF